MHWPCPGPADRRAHCPAQGQLTGGHTSPARGQLTGGADDPVDRSPGEARAARRERRGEAHRCSPPSGGCRPCRPTTSWAEARTDTPGPLLRPGFAATAVGKQSPGAIRPSDREPEPTHRAQSLHEQSPRTIQTHQPAPKRARTVPTDPPDPPTRVKARTNSPHGPSRPTNPRPEPPNRAQSLHEQSPRTIQTHRPTPGRTRTAPTDHPDPPTGVRRPPAGLSRHPSMAWLPAE